MTDKELRLATLDRAITVTLNIAGKTDTDTDTVSKLIVTTAARFEEYVANGKS